MRDPYSYSRRRTVAVGTIGHDNVPRVIADLSRSSIERMEDLSDIGHVYASDTDKWMMRDIAAEYLYMGAHPLPFMAPSGTRQILDFDTWRTHSDTFYCVPMFTSVQYLTEATRHPVMNVVRCEIHELSRELIDALRHDPTVVLMLSSNSHSYYTSMRAACDMILLSEITTPLLFAYERQSSSQDLTVLEVATDIGGLLIDGFGDGLMVHIDINGSVDQGLSTRLAFNVLQAARTRMSKTEYISCPSCGRTLFDLQETTSLIRSHTDHLKGVKIGIMGCIVNGPGEMADADYGYVGSGPERITLYRGQEIVQRNIPTAGAVEALIDIIKTDSRWVERT